MPLRLSKIDELIISDHYYLEEDDECLFLGEYTARKGYAFSPTNNLIYNLKKKPSLRHTSQWRWKLKAIVDAGRSLREALLHYDEGWLGRATFVPVPPSKTKEDQEYDDRMHRVLQEIGRELDLDIREVVLQSSTTLAAHESDDRPNPIEIVQNYHLDESLLIPHPTALAIFDDLLTTGSHFKAMQIALGRQFPEVPTKGIFIARRVPGTINVEDISEF